MERKKRLWPRLLFYFVVGAILLLSLLLLLTPDLAGIANQQLKAMQEDQLTEAYYKYTSRSYQETHSYDTFKQFVRSTPLLQHYTKVQFSEEDVEGNQGKIKAVLQGGGSFDATVDYVFVKEDRQWKVAEMEVHEYDKPGTAKSTATLELIAPVEAQLKAFQIRNFLAAYQFLTARQFQEKTPFSKFKAFVLQHPLFTQFQSYDFKNHFFDNGKGVVTVVLNPEKEAAEVQYSLINEGGTWKILLMKASLPEAKPVDVKELIRVVENELNTLKKGDFQKAYQDYLSDELKSENTLSVFTDFVKHYPILLNFQTINVLEPSIEENIAKVSVELQRDGQSSTVDYVLEMEGGAWKISGLHVQANPVEPDVVDSDETRQVKMREMVDLIHSFLDALKHGEYREAYDQLVSKDFQKNNTDIDLKFFVETHPELVKSNSSAFEKLIFNNNIATLSGYLLLNDDKELPLEFDFIEENGKWKILHIFSMPVRQGSKGETDEEEGIIQLHNVNFPKLLIGSKINEEGTVIEPTTALKQDVSDIYLNLYISNGKKDMPVEVVLRHVDSGSNIPPVHASILQSGSSVINLVFSPPPKGWPKGNYQIRVSANDASFKTFTFTVE